MSDLVDGLVQALKGLHEEEQLEAVTKLLADARFRRSILGSIDQLFGVAIDPIEDEPNPSFENRDASKGLKRATGSICAKAKHDYLDELNNQGILTRPLKNKWVITSNNLAIAICCANEINPYRWFLGLKEAELNELISENICVILLCIAENGKVNDLVLSKQTLLNILPNLSRSPGQLLFNVKASINRDRFVLTVPNMGDFDVTASKGNVSLLK
jgi:hypothetical protein